MRCPAVVIYRRDGCHLCDQARAELLALVPDLPRFELREVDIEADEALHAAMLERIPVIEVGGAVVCELGLDRAAVARALAEVATARRQIP